MTNWHLNSNQKVLKISLSILTTSSPTMVMVIEIALASYCTMKYWFEDDEMLARGEEWQITHVQYLFLEGSTGPPLNSCHFAHFVSLIRRDLIGSCQQQQQHHRGQLMTSPPPSMTSAPNRRGACNCLLKRRFRDSLMNRCSSNSAAAPDESSLLSCDCSKPLVVQCLSVQISHLLLFFINPFIVLILTLLRL